jgi:hypothetical protein
MAYISIHPIDLVLSFNTKTIPDRIDLRIVEIGLKTRFGFIHDTSEIIFATEISALVSNIFSIENP